MGGRLAGLTDEGRTERRAALLLVSLIALFGILGLRTDRAPAPEPASAAADQFSPMGFVDGPWVDCTHDARPQECRSDDWGSAPAGRLPPRDIVPQGR